ncbi:AraC family transcriptional regulator [Bacillus sp. ISL-46]|uniref:AraC family transcriptional regulator n=1 Tax=Bacillus sp. ISL-46 TaxID=2819129 RepID=UPI001BE72893|nr:AraC family transcriptional regulator [Bacillus sp. ISL-46]MBT2722173.1 helix-turn-helix transcriptional regulator [Bacillus sp. ISL-46]
MLGDLSQASIGFQFIMPMPLLMLKGIGWRSYSSPTYIWDGRRRSNEYCLFQYTVSGQGEIEIEGKIYSQKPGDVFIVEIPSDHCYRLPSYSKEWEVLYIEFSKEAIPFWHQLFSLSGPVISVKEDSAFMQLAWTVYELAVKDQIKDVYQCSKYAYQLVMELTSHFYQEQKTRPLPSKIELCKKFINETYQESIGLDDMANAVGISKFHLTREFEKKLGMTPNRYLTQVRLEKATQLLVSSTEMNLEMVAKMVGFTCANYFGKVFKKHMGISPMEFRRNNNHYDMNRILFKK